MTTDDDEAQSKKKHKKEKSKKRKSSEVWEERGCVCACLWGCVVYAKCVFV